MKIGIDIDDTTVTTVDAMLKYADIFNAKVLGRENKYKNLGEIKNKYYLEEVYGWDNKTKFHFLDIYYKNVLEECLPKENAPEVITKLKDDGHEIFFITARLTSIANCEAESITKKMLEENKIPYDKLIVNASDKLKFCKEHGIELFIDDSYDTCEQLEQNGIKTFLMTTKMNQNIDLGSIERVTNWDEIYTKVRKIND